MAGHGATDPAEHVPRHLRRPAPTWLLLVGYLMVGLVVVSVLQGTRLVRVYNVPSGSMERTLGVGDRILVSGLPYLSAGPRRGDIVVFGHGDTWDDEAKPPTSDPLVAAARVFGDVTGIGTASRVHTVKRVIGLPGDTVECCDTQGRVLVNGVPLDEPYVWRDLPFTASEHACSTPARSARCFEPLQVPEGRLLVLGDHRSNSADSVVECRAPRAPASCGRFVEASRVVGVVFAKAWPPGPVG